MQTYYQEPLCTVLQGDALSVLKTMPDESVDICMTSPPYWGLRAYKTEGQIWDGKPDCVHEWGDLLPEHHKGQVEQTKWENAQAAGEGQTAKSGQFCSFCGAWQGELGLEPTFQLYISHLMQIFDEVKRVLKKTGTCWVNIADSYMGSTSETPSKRENSPIAKGTVESQEMRSGRGDRTKAMLGSGLKPKSLIGIPERFALAMTDQLGFIRRNTIIWWKRNPMPESVKDRFTEDFEYLYMFSKQGRYFFEQQFEPANFPNEGKWTQGNNKDYHNNQDMAARKLHEFVSGENRNKRCVWEINTEASAEPHYAAYPEKLCETPILAGCPAAICTKCGKAREKIYKTENMVIKRTDWGAAAGNRTASSGTMVSPATREETGLSDCGCGVSFEPGVVLDPFAGTGTTGAVSKRLGRKSVLIELSTKYCEIIKKKITNVPIPMELGI